ncbi:MAG: hypothetical protein QW197_00060 [Candidatus Aenigmatarchaeota archaeon]
MENIIRKEILKLFLAESINCYDFWMPRCGIENCKSQKQALKEAYKILSEAYLILDRGDVEELEDYASKIQENVENLLEGIKKSLIYCMAYGGNLGRCVCIIKFGNALYGLTQLPYTLNREGPIILSFLAWGEDTLDELQRTGLQHYEIRLSSSDLLRYGKSLEELTQEYMKYRLKTLEYLLGNYI